MPRPRQTYPIGDNVCFAAGAPQVMLRMWIKREATSQFTCTIGGFSDVLSGSGDLNSNAVPQSPKI